MINKIATKADYPVILDLWEKSVRASHDFLAEDDFFEIKKQLPKMLPDVEIMLWYDNSLLVGFSGTRKDSLEMLFIEPGSFAKGYGKQIITILKEQGITKVDVNEQNIRGKDFYLRNDFKIVSRSEVDDAGRPYPILHLSTGE